MNELISCPYCKSENTEIFYDVFMPNILSACGEDILRQVAVYRVLLKVCCECVLGFAACPPTEEQLHFIYDNYLYISPMKGIGRTKYKGILETIFKWCKKKDLIVEIGCSEGYLLSKLKENEYENILGVEPGPQEEIARTQGFRTIKKYYSRDVFESGTVDVFLLKNVFEHFQNFEDTLDAMIEHLSVDGRIIIEVPDFMGFHVHHLFYYSLHFFMRLAEDKSLSISDWHIEQNALWVVLTKKIDNIRFHRELIGIKGSVLDRARSVQRNFGQKLKSLKGFFAASKDSVYWWGAGSVSVIYLNQLKSADFQMSNIRIIDSDKGKQGCFIPGAGLKVDSADTLRGKNLDCLVIASSLFNEIKETMEKNNIISNNIFILES